MEIWKIIFDEKRTNQFNYQDSTNLKKAQL